MEVKMAQGIFYTRSTKGLPKDIITWHEKAPYRIFIHSREDLLGTRKTISISIEIVGKKPLPLSEEEKSARLRLAVIASDRDENVLNSAAIRSIAIGKIIEEHTQLVALDLQKTQNYEKQNVSLVSEIKSLSVKNIIPFQLDSVEEMKKIGGTSGDAILVAKIYTLIAASGPSKVTKRTADLLQVDVETVRTAIRIARRNNWLTTAGHGKSGGILTKEGEQAFIKLNGPYRLQKIYGISSRKGAN
jgi:hypothetical protein